MRPRRTDQAAPPMRRRASIPAGRALLTALVIILACVLSAPAHAEDGTTGGGGDGSGGAGSGGAGSGGGSGPQAPPGISVPRVMLTEFISEPATVVAGEKATLTFTLKNMSNTVRVENVRITLTPVDTGAFLPVKGSSSIYVRAIYAGSTVTESIEMRTLPTLEQRPYAITLQLEYEDSEARPYTSAEQVAVPVSQPQRLSTSTPEVLPGQVAVGQQAAVTFSVNNLGRTELFNVRAEIPAGQSVAAQQAFVGTIEPGSSGFVDLTLEAVAAGTEPVTIQISYEDANGEVTTTTVPVALTVTAEAQREGPPTSRPVPQEVSTGPSMILVLAGIAAAVLLTVLIVLVVRRQRRKAAQRDSELALLDDAPLLPDDQD